MKKTWKKKVMDYLIIALAAICYAAAISLLLDPNNLAPGGVSGISIILSRVIPVETGTLFLLFNIPILMLGLWKFGFRFLVSTIYCILLVSVFTNIFAAYGPLTEEPFLAAAVGGALVAVSIGTVFKRGATTGGTDIIIKLLRLRFPHLKTGALFLIIDCTIIVCSILVFKDIDRALYAGLSVLVTSKVLDLVLYGKDGAKLLYIISDKSEELTARFLEELDLGVTHMQGYGAYSGKEKKVIMCVIKKQVYHKAESIVKEEDPMAFMIVSSASEIYGEGYKSYFSEKL
ncbi:MAG: YitT family protein [Lachnospiraceae bacterium]|nr:YitT family protein [Lachnospiraceae bacterium]